MNIPVIYEDSDLIVIDKPAGMVVNKAESVKEETVQEWAGKKLKVPRGGEVPPSLPAGRQVPRGEKARDTRGTFYSRNTFYERAGVVHRLDKETSGILLIAKTEDAFEKLQAQFKNREVSKKYVTLVHGELKDKGEIKASVGRLPWNKERFGVLAGGREALTSYKSLKSFKSFKREILTLLEVTPHTGRTHQIRIHLKYIGHPVVSDPFYAGRKVYRKDIKFCPRLFLHAAYIKFRQPKTNLLVEFESKLPRDLEKVLEKLRYV